MRRGERIMKKKLFAVLLAACLTLCVFPVTAFAAENNGTKLIAHRGYSGSAPENTLAAARLAGENGFDACEFDIWPTKDRVWVVMHDETVDRMTDGTGAISDMTLEEVKKLRIDAGNGVEKYPDENVPTLNEMLDECESAGIMPVIEIKNGDEDNLEALASQLEKSGLIDKCTVISFNKDCLTGMRKLCPTLDLRFLVKKVNGKSIKFCKENDINGVSCSYGSSFVFGYRRLRKSGLKMTAWTVNDPKHANNLVDHGFEYITTDSLVPGTVKSSGEHTFKTDLKTLGLKLYDLLPNFIKNAFNR